MSCPELHEWEDYLQNRLAPEQHQVLDEHVQTCHHCRLALETARANEVLLGELLTLGLAETVTPKSKPVVPLDLAQAQEWLGERYRIVRHVSTTLHSDVFQAVDTVLERQVAIKFLKPGSDQPDYGWREARAMSKLNHPGIGQLFEIGKAEQRRFIVLEWIDGLPLTEAWKGLQRSQRLRLLLEVIDAVAFAHHQAIVHRDLKPTNILVTTDLHPKVLDFGLALDAREDQQQTQDHFRGTPAFCAPEQIQDPEKISPATDVFALGVLLYHMLTDSPPFDLQSPEALLDAVVHDYPLLPTALCSDIPIALQNICLKAMEKDPSQRYRQAGDLARDLQRHLRGEKVWARPTFLTDQVQQELFQHRQKLKVWRDNDLLTEREYDRLEQVYDQLDQPPDASIIESRRLSLSQVCLYLGGWIAVLGCVILFYKSWDHIPLTWRPAPALGATVIMGLMGTLLWRAHESRLALGFLATANLLIPLSLGLTLGQWQWLTAAQCHWGDESIYQWLEQTHATILLGNTQLYLTAWCWLTVSVVWLRWTRSSLFMLFTVCASLALWTVTLLIRGMVIWSLATVAGYYVMFAVFLILIGAVLERSQWRRYAGSPAIIGMALTIGALSILALSNQTLFGWLGLDPIGLSNIEQRFLSLFINGLLYLGLGHLYRRLDTPLHRNLAQTYNWLGPIHLLAPLRLLDLDALDQDIAHRIAYRIALPIVSLGCIAASVTRQMKSFFVSGLGGIAASIHKITTAHLSGIFTWPVCLILSGIGSMLVSWWVPRWQAKQQLQKNDD